VLYVLASIVEDGEAGSSTSSVVSLSIHQESNAMRPTILDFVRSQWATLPPSPTLDLTGQTVLVTGSNTGLGLEAAKQFARMKPAHLVLAVRNTTKGEEALSSESYRKDANF
jgi:hypothetical protein